jgi:hypothetical protein
MFLASKVCVFVAARPADQEGDFVARVQFLLGAERHRSKGGRVVLEASAEQRRIRARDRMVDA